MTWQKVKHIGGQSLRTATPLVFLSPQQEFFPITLEALFWTAAFLHTTTPPPSPSPPPQFLLPHELASMSLFFGSRSMSTSWSLPPWRPAHFPLPAAHSHAQTTHSLQQFAVTRWTGSENKPGWEQTISWVIFQPVQSHSPFTERRHKWFANPKGKVLGKGPSGNTSLVAALPYANLRWFSSYSWYKWDTSIKLFSPCWSAKFSRRKMRSYPNVCSLCCRNAEWLSPGTCSGLQGKGDTTTSHAAAILPIPSFLSGLANWYASWYNRDLIFSQISKLCVLCVLIE